MNIKIYASVWSHTITNRSSICQKKCQYVVTQDPYKICGIILRGRGRSKYCEDHSHEAYRASRKTHNKKYTNRHHAELQRHNTFMERRVEKLTEKVANLEERFRLFKQRLTPD